MSKGVYVIITQAQYKFGFIYIIIYFCFLSLRFLMEQAQLSSDKPQGRLGLGLPWKFGYICTSDLGARKFDKNQTYGLKGSKRGQAKGEGGGMEG